MFLIIASANCDVFQFSCAFHQPMEIVGYLFLLIVVSRLGCDQFSRFAPSDVFKHKCSAKNY
jgi:hypothetical protein